jgi:predicted Ser/Thr protein kinase
VTQPPDSFPRLVREARSIPEAKRAEWIAALDEPPHVKARLTSALQSDATIATQRTMRGTQSAGAPVTGGAAGQSRHPDTVGGVAEIRRPDGPAPDATIVTRGATLSEGKPDAGARTTAAPARVGPGTDPMIGRTFAGVVIEKILGSGGMGRVYLGTDGPGGPAVALKVLLRTQRDDGIRHRFEREGRVLKELQHPCIAKVLRTGVEEDGDTDIPYIVMEYVEGVMTITDYVFRQRMGTREAAELYVQVCDAVGYAHSKGYIHRDIKPQNILVNRHGRVKVIDFGVARAASLDSAAVTVRTETGQIVGTMQYMSPEQFKADPRLVDKRSDVYALAAVLYELVSGVQPHDLRGLPVHEAARIVCDTDAPDVRQCNPRVDATLAALLAEGLSRSPDRRPDDALAFGRRLKGWVSTPAPTIVATIHQDHPDKIFDRKFGDGRAKSELLPGFHSRPGSARPGRAKAGRGGWTAVTVVTGLLAVAVLVAFDVIPVRQLVVRLRDLSGTRQAAAGTTGTASGTSGGAGAKAAAPGKPARGATIVEQVQVVTSPEGASLSVNGESRGVSPAIVLTEVSRGGSVEITATKEGWGPASAVWTQGKDPPLLALNLAPATTPQRLARVFLLRMDGVASGTTLSVVEPIRRELTGRAETITVEFERAGGKWRPVPLTLEARDASGRPLALQVGARRGVGSVSFEALPEDAAQPLRVRIGEAPRGR